MTSHGGHMTAHGGHMTSHGGHMTSPWWSHDWSYDITSHNITQWLHDIAGNPHLVCAFCATVCKRVVHLRIEGKRITDQ